MDYPLKKTLSIIIPVFNEEKTIQKILGKIEGVHLPGIKKEVIIVDDGSTDNTKEILKSLKNSHLILYHNRNQGKGSAILTALPHAKGDYIIIQDADLEYDPADWPRMLEELEKDKNVGAVYGSRNLENKTRGYFHYYLGGRFLTALINLFFHGNLTDVNTGCKLFRSEALKSLSLKSIGFEFCEEVTIRLLKKGALIKETPIHYYPRTFQEGKKITFRDGLIGVWTIVKNYFSK